ncbi:Gfo/Idh/MocA family protein [Streptomyces cinnamoneus]|uniref:Inositol 2-dehydrogenase n=1 Tax=Streptomyces cinnamoneus TaxID=53446 RepID=A0A918WND2_STRCJ|nr:Gfo/Idh/MocA family oxidoreductase [Streptomyces cinnamoneus]GHC62975.1 inositol 2-dehydrogenase [Streptomyces cinnamoneus]
MTHNGTLGVAVIGTGRMGSDHVRRLDEVVSGARVSAVVDIDAARAEAVAARVPGCTAWTDPAAAMASADVDAVLVASPGPAHEAALLAAFEHDLPVLCEKPLTPDAASALRVVQAETRLGHRRVQVGFMRRYDAEFRQLKALLDGGGLGRALMLHCTHRNASTPPGFTSRMTINDSVVHEIDVTRWLLGQEITAVTVLRPAPSGDAPAGLSDPQLVLLETSGGAVVDVEIFVNCGFGYQVRCEAVGERGTARAGDAHGLYVNAAGRWGGEIAQDYVVRFRDAYDRQLQTWVDATRRGETVGPSAWDGYAAAAVCEAGVRAQETGLRTPVTLTERPGLYAADEATAEELTADDTKAGGAKASGTTAGAHHGR